MTEVERLTEFVTRANYAALSERARQQLKIRILDSLGCAIGALAAEPIGAIRAQLRDFGGNPLCVLYNGALVRYLDFMDSYLGAGETCHPGDNLAAVLAAAEYAGASGEALLTALAVAYQVHACLSDEAPVRARGFDQCSGATKGSRRASAGRTRSIGEAKIWSASTARS
jgi:2-methylcitrate dehydratase